MPHPFTTTRKGAVGALLGEYGRAIASLTDVIQNINNNLLTAVTDPETEDENCRSLQTILAHVVHAGYGYAASTGNAKGAQITRQAKIMRSNVQEYIADLEAMFAYAVAVFLTIEDADLEQKDNDLKIKTGWGQLYDIEQLTEHAIVHILRHRRQIEGIMARQ